MSVRLRTCCLCTTEHTVLHQSEKPDLGHAMCQICSEYRAHESQWSQNSNSVAAIAKSEFRIDYAPLLALVEELLPSAIDREAILHDTPCRVFGFER